MTDRECGIFEESSLVEYLNSSGYSLGVLHTARLQLVRSTEKAKHRTWQVLQFWKQ